MKDHVRDIDDINNMIKEAQLVVSPQNAATIKVLQNNIGLILE